MFHKRNVSTPADILAKNVLTVRVGPCLYVSVLICQFELVKGKGRTQKMDQEKLIENVKSHEY